MKDAVVRLGLPPSSRVMRLLSAIVAFLVMMHLIAEASGLDVLRSQWLLGRESSFPTWWSSFQLAVLSALLWAVSRRYADRAPQAARSLAIGAASALFFSVDEVATIHESITGVLERFDFVPRFAGEHGIWILVYGAIGLVLLAYLVPGLAAIVREEPANALWFSVGAAMFVAGGVGVEIIGYFSGPLILLEETLEIVGVSVMVIAVYRTLQNHTVELVPGGPRSE